MLLGGVLFQHPVIKKKKKQKTHTHTVDTREPLTFMKNCILVKFVLNRFLYRILVENVALFKAGESMDEVFCTKFSSIEIPSTLYLKVQKIPVQFRAECVYVYPSNIINLK